VALVPLVVGYKLARESVVSSWDPWSIELNQEGRVYVIDERGGKYKGRFICVFQ